MFVLKFSHVQDRMVFDEVVVCTRYRVQHHIDKGTVTVVVVDHEGKETGYELGNDAHEWRVCFVMNKDGKTIEALRAPKDMPKLQD